MRGPYLRQLDVISAICERARANCGGRADTADQSLASLFPHHLPVGLQGTLWSPKPFNCAQKKGGPGAPDTQGLERPVAGEAHFGTQGGTLFNR